MTRNDDLMDFVMLGIEKKGFPGAATARAVLGGIGRRIQPAMASARRLARPAAGAAGLLGLGGLATYLQQQGEGQPVSSTQPGDRAATDAQATRPTTPPINPATGGTAGGTQAPSNTTTASSEGLPNWAKGLGVAGAGLGAGLLSHYMAGEEEDEMGEKHHRAPWLGPAAGLGTAALGTHLMTGGNWGALTDPEFWSKRSAASIPLILVPWTKNATGPSLLGGGLDSLQHAAQPIPHMAQPSLPEHNPSEPTPWLSPLQGPQTETPNPLMQHNPYPPVQLPRLQSIRDQRASTEAQENAPPWPSPIQVPQQTQSTRQEQWAPAAQANQTARAEAQQASTVHEPETPPPTPVGAQQGQPPRVLAPSNEQGANTQQNAATATGAAQMAGAGASGSLSPSAAIASRVVSMHPELQNPEVVNSMGTQQLARQLGNQNQPGFLDHVTSMWRSLGNPDGSLSIQQILLAAGLSLGAIGLLGSLTGSETLGGGTGALLGLGGLAAAAYGSGMFNSNSPVRRMISGQLGQGGQAGQGMSAFEGQQLLSALETGNLDSVGGTLQRMLSQPGVVDQVTSPLATPQRLASNLTALAHSQGLNNANITPEQAARLQQWVNAHRSQLTGQAGPVNTQRPPSRMPNILNPSNVAPGIRRATEYGGQMANQVRGMLPF